jgi:hypothetical protein
MLGEAGNGDDQEADQEPADHYISGKEEALPRLEPLAVGVAEELGELLVDLNAGQKPREARAEAPEFAPRGVASARREKPQDHGAEQRVEHEPEEDAEAVISNSVARSPFERRRQRAGPSGGQAPRIGANRFSLAFAAKITDFVRVVGVAGFRERRRQLRIRGWRVFRIEPRPIVPPSHAAGAHFRAGLALEAAKIVKGEAIERQMARGRPCVAGIHEIADVGVAQHEVARPASRSVHRGLPTPSSLNSPPINLTNA